MHDAASGTSTWPSGAPFRDWTVFTTLAAVGTVVAILLLPEREPLAVIVAIAICLTVQGLYLLLARPGVVVQHEDSPRAWTWAAIAFVLFAGGVWLEQWTTLLLFSISPAVFLAFRQRTAIPLIVVFDLVPLATELLKYPITPTSLVADLGLTGITMAVSIFFSGRIQSVIRESEERRRLLEELQERQSEVAALSTAQGAAAERTRIAREMHDTLAQGFASIVALGNAAQTELATDPDTARRHLELITATAAENLGESRRIIAALQPGRLAGTSLPEAIRRTAEQFAAESGVAAGFTLRGEPRPLQASVDVVLLRAAQEALTNVRRHAAAAHADVTLDMAADHVELEVCDDGDGFETGATAGHGYGLTGMADRAAEVGGTLTVESRPGQGTRVRVRVPLATDSDGPTTRSGA